MNDKLRPVVAVDMDGVVRLHNAFGVPLIPLTVTLKKDEYPTLFHGQPRWNAEGEHTAVDYFSEIAVEFLRELSLDSGVELVLATTWQRWANTYFMRPFGLPDFPVAVRSLTEEEGGNWFHCSPSWKTFQLAQNFPGRPLIWLDDNMPDRPGEDLEELRRPRDQALTRSYHVDGQKGLTEDDTAAIREWLTLASAVEGQKQLRTEHREKITDERRARAKANRTWEREMAAQGHVREILEKLYPANDFFVREVARLGRAREGLTSENISLALTRHSLTGNADELVEILRKPRYHRDPKN